MNLVDIKECPICGNTKSNLFLESNDYSTSKKDFSIRECASCNFRFTSPIPSENQIGSYYESEDYISHTDSNKGIMNKVYQTVRNRAIKQKQNLISSLTAEKTLLDIGCGTGDFLKFCQDHNWQTIGLEPSASAREICHSKSVEAKDIDQLHELENNSISVITMWHVLEHVYHLNRDFKQIKSVLKDDGRLVIAVPNCSSYDASKYGKYWAAYDLPIHLYHFRPNDIKELARKFEMEVENILPMKFDSYYVSMLSEKYKGGNKASAFFAGAKSNRKANSENNQYSSQIYILKKK
ncbi:MAG: class I SAM-dependent methyltransferase [Flavobacteriales bacterium]|nr:class I SAM-dependent methyltransferase [Flavobacteriales bacterium]